MNKIRIDTQKYIIYFIFDTEKKVIKTKKLKHPKRNLYSSQLVHAL